MHINSDLHVVEHVDLKQPTASLAITPLENYGMPLLRYVNDDLADNAPGKCACGRPYPAMSAVEGRTSDNFKTPDGRLIHGEYLTHLMYGIEGVQEFQFVQRELTVVVLSVVPSNTFGAATDARLGLIASKFGAYFGFPLQIILVDHIKPAPSGKRRFTVSLI